MNAIWKHLQFPDCKFWLVCVKRLNGNPRPVVIPYHQAIQEDYVQDEEHSEGVLNVFTTPGAADRYRDRLMSDGTGDFVVKRIGLDGLLKLIKSIDDSYRIVKHHGIRVDVYDTTGLTLVRELLYSKNVIKH